MLVSNNSLNKKKEISIFFCAFLILITYLEYLCL